ncbi:replication initiator protein [Escherichia coli]|nr:replication initiator protein [Escherichia coli]
MGSCAAPSAKGDDKFITTDYLQQCPRIHSIMKRVRSIRPTSRSATARLFCRG